MNSLVQFILKLLGLGDNAIVEKLVKGVLLGGNKSADPNGPNGSGNPLEKLMAQFKDKGLGNIFASWVGGGKNEAVTPEQIKQGVGNGPLQSMAAKAGLPVDVMAAKLAQYLPGLIDKMTPGGKIPPA